ncbi:MAG: hypothetical protein AAFS07_18900 [Pseudomonadota bacterium]
MDRSKKASAPSLRGGRASPPDQGQRVRERLATEQQPARKPARSRPSAESSTKARRSSPAKKPARRRSGARAGAAARAPDRPAAAAAVAAPSASKVTQLEARIRAAKQQLQTLKQQSGNDNKKMVRKLNQDIELYEGQLLAARMDDRHRERERNFDNWAERMKLIAGQFPDYTLDWDNPNTPEYEQLFGEAYNSEEDSDYDPETDSEAESESIGSEDSFVSE